MTEIQFIKEIVFKKCPGKIFILAFNELIGSFLVIAGVGTIIPLIATLIGDASLPGDSKITRLIQFLGLDTASAGQIITVLIFILIGQFTINAIRQYLSASIGIALNKALRKELNAKILYTSWLHFLKIDQGQYLQCMIQESALAQGAVNDLGSVIANIVLLGILTLAIAYVSLKFLAIILVIAPIILYLSNLIVRLSRPLAEKRIISQNYFNNFMIDNANLFKTIKAEGTEDTRINQSNAIIDSHKSIEIKQLLYNVFLAHFYNIIMIIGIAILSYIYTHYELSDGSTFLFNLLLMQRCGAYLKELQVKRKNMLQKIPSYQTCISLLEEIPEIETKPSRESFSAIPLQNITFENISFEYNKNAPVITNLNMNLPQTGLVAFIGESGSGKTTILDILSGLLSPSSGVIRIGNTTYPSLSDTTWNRLITYVSQNSYLFQGSVKDNLLFGTLNKTTQDIENALKKTSCHGFINKLPDGMDTIVKSGGSNFSGGERQRLGLARGLLRDSRIIILDEPSSSLDKKNETAIAKTLENLKKDYLIIVVTHSLDFVKNFDTIHLVKGGSIEWSGQYADIPHK